MNREILFKAKRLGNGEWVEGYYYKTLEHVYILQGETADLLRMYKVDPNALCQYTCYSDKNGKRIWENDILVEKHKGIATMKYRVVFDLEEGAWMLETKSGARYGIGAVNQRNFEACGNVFDNPELLEVE